VHAALERVAARRAEVTLGASEDLAARARAAGGRDVRFAPVTAPPLAPATRDRSAVRADLGVGDRPLVLVVARLAAQKRLDLLVRATRGWLDDPTGPMVVVAGDGRLRDEVRAAAAAHRSSVVLLGHRNDVADLLQAADLLALPSDWEARPLVVQEALRAGVPVVATDVGGVAGLVGEAGLLVPAGDVEALRSAMQRLLGDPAERQRLASLGRARAATWPTVEDMVDDLEALYLDLRSRFSRRSRQ
jgi:glycosyltransferase involved in cell wall biosynthesis